MGSTLIAVVVLAAILTALGQSADVPQPTQGFQLGEPPASIDIILPLSITQCEPVLIYYSNPYNDTVNVFLYPPDNGYGVLNLYFPPGVGYMDWICNIPSGYSFVVSGVGPLQYYTVQPGSSSACLGNVTTTYPYATYHTDRFQSYTQQSPSGNSLDSLVNQQATVTFPTSTFPTITANPNLAVTSTITTSAVSSPLVTSSASSPSSPATSSTSSSSSPVTSSASSPSPQVSSSASLKKSRKAVVAGGVVGGVTLVLVILTIAYVFLRKRRNSRSHAALGSPTVESELKPHSGLISSQPALMTYSAPLLPDQETNVSQANSTDAILRGSEFTHSTGRTAVLDTPSNTEAPWSYPHPSVSTENLPLSAPIAAAVPPVPRNFMNNPPPYHLPRQSTNGPRNLWADLASSFDVTRMTTSQRLALIAFMNTPANVAAPEASSPTSRPTDDHVWAD